MIKEFGSDFKDLHDIEGVHSVKYIVGIKKFEIVSSELAYQEVSHLNMNKRSIFRSIRPKKQL